MFVNVFFVFVAYFLSLLYFYTDFSIYFYNLNMKKIISLALTFFLGASAFANDLIITRDAKKLDAKVTEIGIFVIKYKLLSEGEDGPTYVMPKSKIAAITYENGRVETYFDGNTMASDTSLVDSVIKAAPAEPQPEVKTVETPAQVGPTPASDAELADPVEEMDSRYASYDSFDYYLNEDFRGFRFKIDAGGLFGGRNIFDGVEYDEDDCGDYHHHGHNRHYEEPDSSHSIGAGLEASLSFGYQFNPYIYLGAGVDVQFFDKFDYTVVSEFLDVNVSCFRKQVTPMLGLRVGISSMVDPVERFGFFAEPTVGVQYRFNPKYSLSFNLGYRAAAYDLSDKKDAEYIDKFESLIQGAFLAKIGFVF